MIPHQRHGSGAPAIGGATDVQAGDVLGIADADRGQAVLQGLVVEAHPVLAADRGQYVGAPLFGHAILVGVAIVLGPVSLDVELEALVGLAVEGGQGLPLVVGNQRHGERAPGIGGATQVQGRQHAVVGAVAVGDSHSCAGTGGQPLGIGDCQGDGMGARGIELDCLSGGAAAGRPAVARHAFIVGGGGAIEHHALPRLDAEDLGREGGDRCLVAGERGDRIAQIAFAQGDAVAARPADQDILAAALVGDAVPFVVAVALGPVAEDVELETLGTGGVTAASQGQGGGPDTVGIDCHGGVAPGVVGAAQVHAAELVARQGGAAAGAGLGAAGDDGGCLHGRHVQAGLAAAVDGDIAPAAVVIATEEVAVLARRQAGLHRGHQAAALVVDGDETLVSPTEGYLVVAVIPPVTDSLPLGSVVEQGHVHDGRATLLAVPLAIGAGCAARRPLVGFIGAHVLEAVARHHLLPAIGPGHHEGVGQLVAGTAHEGEHAAAPVAALAVVVDHEDEGLVGGEQAPALAEGLEVLDLAVEVGGQIRAVFEVGDCVYVGVATRLDVRRFPACTYHLQIGFGAARLVEYGLHLAGGHVLGRIDAKARHAPTQQGLHVGGYLILHVGRAGIEIRHAVEGAVPDVVAVAVVGDVTAVVEVVVAELGILILPRVVAAAAGGCPGARGQLVEDGVRIDLDPGRIAAGDHAPELRLAAAEAVEVLEADGLVDGPPDLAPLLVFGGRSDLDTTESLGAEHCLALVGDVVELPLEQVDHDPFGGGCVAE
ncbi:hypothetical protein D3C86_1120830 [compost metagenome]